ncbi:MAG: hypothetical protein DRJ38_05930 [Thermoprotei archaeon]|mgnify:CR=1 FL=1|nr:MAG: hypothetical protein DRJ38_05930 [Thermoprotei archaeon]
MEDKEKLKALVKHWSEHSLEHRENFLKWAKKADEMELKEAGKCLREAARAMEEAAKNLDKALKFLN